MIGGAALAAVLLPALYVAGIFIRIRIVEMLEDRIGHLAGNTDIFARRQRLKNDGKDTVWLFVAHNPANRQLMDMWKRHFVVIENRMLKHLYIGALPLLKMTRFHVQLPSIPVDWDPIVFTSPEVLSFTDAEEERGRKELRAIGIGEDDWFVCFHARDPQYMATREGFGTQHYDAPESYLDSSISNYLMAMEWVVSQGGIAVRMGQAVSEPLPDMGPRVIDYATRFRSDFLDIYLPAKCRMFLGNNSGFFWTALIFNRPVALANLCPFPYVGGGGKWLFDIPKILCREVDGSPLTIPEIKSLNMLECRQDEPDRLADIFKGTMHREYKLRWRENTPEEILDLCVDRIDALEDRAPDPEARRLQKAFNQMYENAAPHTRDGGISPRFALRHRHLIEPETDMNSMTQQATANESGF